MKKTFILNEKTPKCKTCKHFLGVSCILHDRRRGIPVFPDDFCNLHSDFVDIPNVCFKGELTSEEKASIRRRIDNLFVDGFRGRGLA